LGDRGLEISNKEDFQMKYVSYIAFCAVLLCCPATRSISALTLSAADVKFLTGCGVLQEDIKVIPNLPRAGQLTLSGILRSDDRECNDLKPFKDSRDFLRKFTPPPSKAPWPPAGYDNNFLTKAESDYVNKIEKDILDRIFRN
jgi:hypothetical protein